MDSGGYARIGPVIVPRVRLYRAAALTAGAPGTLVSLAWDATSALATKIGYGHSTSSSAEQITAETPGLHDLRAAVRFAPALLLTGLRLEIQVDTGSGFAMVGSSALPAAGTAIVVSGETTIDTWTRVELPMGAIVRVQFAGITATNAPVVVGDGATWFEAAMLGS